MAEVRQVFDHTVQTNLAMKLLLWPAARSLEACARFVTEAQLTAQLAHPGVVSVQDIGELPDGRPWYTMTLVVGRTLTQVLAEEAPLRRHVELYLRVCEVVAYAHANGVLHRDIKPDNIMVGSFGEVRVMDWGLGARVDEHAGTVHGLGTPGWMAPEQARGEPLGFPVDVYALGCILYRILAGVGPYTGTAMERFHAVVQGPPMPIRDRVPLAPDGLLRLCAWTMHREQAKRPSHAAVVEARVRDWLEGARRRTQALELVERADGMVAGLHQLRCQRDQLLRDAADLRVDLRDYDPVVRKRASWRAQDEADRIEVKVGVEQDRWLLTLRAALAQVPELPEAHERLAEHYAQELTRAEHLNRPGWVARYEAQLRSHDDGTYADVLMGVAKLDVVTDPPDARVTAFPFVENDRRRVLGAPIVVGTTPIVGALLPHGSYLLKLERPGHLCVRYPVHLKRGGHWHGRPPGASKPQPIWLPPADLIGPNWCYVPTGWFSCGGDPDAIDAGSSRELWVGGFAIYKNPVTVGEYVTFLRGLAEDDIAAHLPGGAAGTQVLRVDGLLQLGTDLSGYNIVKDLPVVRVSWSSAVAFAQTVWPGARLPSGVEWEKAARGVDGRRYPMGNYLDPTWAVLAASLASSPRRQPVTALSYDVSPYNVRGMAGNVRDWCADSWRHQGETDGSIHQPQWNVLATTPREVRGGCYTSRNQMSRCASRMVARPTQRLLSVVGFRPLVPEAALRQWAARD